MKKALMRSNTHLLLSAVMLFQALAMLLIAFQKEAFNPQALALAVALCALALCLFSGMSNVLIVLLGAAAGLIYMEVKNRHAVS